MTRLDGKFEVLREVDRSGARVSYEALHPDGRPVRVDWFAVNDPKSRSSFHRYRTALKSAGSPLLLDAVARPGAYYTVWLPAGSAPEAAAWLASHPRDDAFRAALEALAQTLADYGFALTDARTVAWSGEGGRGEARPALERLELADRSAEEIAALNRPLLGRPAAGPRRGFAARTPTEARPRPARPARLGPAPAAVASAADPAPLLAPRPSGLTRPGTRAEGSLSRVPAVASTGGSTRPVSGSRGALLTALDGGPPAAPADSVPAPRRLTIWGVLPGLVCLALAGSRGFAVVQDFLEPPTVTVPKVVDRPLREAVRVLVDRRLTPVTEDGADQAKAPGLILRQDPPADTVLPESRTVTLTVNRPKPLTVPSLAGKPLREARALLAARGLRLERTVLVPLPEAKGLVVAQTPDADSPTVKNSGVTLLLGAEAAPKVTFLPDLRGLPLEDAKGLVALAGLTLVSVSTEAGGGTPGAVVAQSPAPYTRVPAGGDAVLRVSAPASAPVPVRASPRVEPRPTSPLAADPTPSPSPEAPPEGPPSAGTPPSSPPSSQIPEPSAPIPSPATPATERPAPTAPAPPARAAPANPTPLVQTPPSTGAPDGASQTDSLPSPAANPAAPDPASVAPAGTRPVSLTYLVPPALSLAQVEVRLADLDGDKVVYGPQQLSGGDTVKVTDWPARGPATFVVFVDGVEQYRQAVP